MDFVKVANSLGKMYDNLDKLYNEITNIETISLILDSAKRYYIENNSCSDNRLNQFDNILYKVINDFLNCKDNLKELTDKAWSEYIEIDKQIQTARNDLNVKSV